MDNNTVIIKLKTLTAIWTGDIDRRTDNLRETSIVGSIRWWYESLVRGLGGFACDPTSSNSCIFDEEAYFSTNSIDAGLQDVCPVCRVFGCTGYGSKFRLMITDRDGNSENVRPGRRGGDEFHLHFVFSRSLRSEEQWLLAKTFELIDDYGSIGGQTTKKPPKLPDYGLVKVFQNVNQPQDLSRELVEEYLHGIVDRSESIQSRLEQTAKEIPRLDLFFFKKGYWIKQNQINDLMRIDRTRFLAGERGISKKVFSFKERGAARLWGYTTDTDMLNSVMRKLEQMGVRGTKTGKEVLSGL